MKEVEKGETKIVFRISCDSCDLIKDFTPGTNHYTDINTSMREAIRATKDHTRLTAHNPSVKVIPKPPIGFK